MFLALPSLSSRPSYDFKPSAIADPTPQRKGIKMRGFIAPIFCLVTLILILLILIAGSNKNVLVNWFFLKAMFPQQNITPAF
jgi:uncharacterized integral membrane protein